MDAEVVGNALGPGGRYSLKGLVARGGFGAVYRAWDTSLQREVAVKVLIATLLHEPAFVERFRREALAVAKLRHRHILEVYDFGEQSDGTLYIVMPLIEGGTLKDRFYQDSRRPWNAGEAHSLAAQLLPALDYAHEHGIVHRDVKPGNVLLERDWAWLADFGIARMALGDSGVAGGTLTGASSIGTPEYMAPEQVTPDPDRQLDGRADLYAFGVVLYELLTGRVPFRGETTWETCYQVMHAPLPRPREINPALPEPIEAILMRALARDRDERFSSGAEFEAALRSAISSEPDQTPSPHVQEPPTVVAAERSSVVTVNSGLAARLVRALKLDNSVYEQVRADSSRRAVIEAGVVVAVTAAMTWASFSATATATSFSGKPLSDAIGGLFGGLAGWAVWSFLSASVGTGLFKGNGTAGQVLRTAGLAQVPNICSVVALVPTFGILLYLPVAVWALLAEIGALRQTLRLSTPQAVMSLVLAGLVSTPVQWLIAYALANAAGQIR